MSPEQTRTHTFLRVLRMKSPPLLFSPHTATAACHRNNVSGLGVQALFFHDAGEGHPYESSASVLNPCQKAGTPSQSAGSPKPALLLKSQNTSLMLHSRGPGPAFIPFTGIAHRSAQHAACGLPETPPQTRVVRTRSDPRNHPASML